MEAGIWQRARKRLRCGTVVGTAMALCILPGGPHLYGQSRASSLPDSPGALLMLYRRGSSIDALVALDAHMQNSVQDAAQHSEGEPPLPLSIALPAAQDAARTPVPFVPQPVPLPCPRHQRRRQWPAIFLPSVTLACMDDLHLIVDTGYVAPMTSWQKGTLALDAVIDPFNLLTIGAFSAISVAANAHSDYGPGLKGWGRLSGYSFVEDAQLEFTGVYLLPSIFHEDPRYHRMPGAPVKRRIEHALIHGFVSQHDDGALMPNYATLINYPLSDEISNLYVPGLGTNLPSTAKRVVLGYATEPVGPLLAEFLPDVAKRVHVHIIFAQQILNQLALGSAAPSSSD